MIAEQEAALLKEQELYNRLRNKDYGPAIALALELKRPQKLWGVLRDAMTEGMGEGVPGAAGNEGERGRLAQQCIIAAVYHGIRGLHQKHDGFGDFCSAVVGGHVFAYAPGL